MTAFGRCAAVGLVLVLGLGCGDENLAGSVGLGMPGSSTPVADSGWPLHGGTPDGARYSPLKAIDRSNVAKLGLAWSYATDSHRGLEATPIVKDGVLYATSTWSRAFALDAATGEEIWSYDPKVPGEVGRKACCDVVNRGVAVEDGRVYLGALDGRLIALDAKTGKLLWEVQTVDTEKPYTITGAPRVVKGKVVIGNGGRRYGACGVTSAHTTQRPGNSSGVSTPCPPAPRGLTSTRSWKRRRRPGLRIRCSSMGWEARSTTPCSTTRNWNCFTSVPVTPPCTMPRFGVRVGATTFTCPPSLP